MWSSLLTALDETSRDRLDAALIPRSCAKGRFLFREGEPGDSVFIVASGHLLVEQVTANGDVVAVGVLQADDIVGEQALVSNEPRMASVRAITAVRGWTLHRPAFDEVRRDHPALDRLLVSVLDQRVRSLQALVSEARHVPAEVRLRRRLHELCVCFDGEIPLTQQAIATMAGTTRPTVNACLQQLREAGAVSLRRGRISVIDPDRLAPEAR
ncbi:MAG: Crp/Fnr family transcriptional regulator [Acidimicrobiia bacterium]|nr:Crp/Fnr family transcriptional regulator [Acidimicrobiia bacterium]